jgi:REP element-mobilizing transposase RayT
MPCSNRQVSISQHKRLYLTPSQSSQIHCIITLPSKIHSSIIILYPSECAVTYLHEGFPPKSRMRLVSRSQKYYINISDYYKTENIIA